MQNFQLGANFAIAAVVNILDRWIQAAGVHANARIGGIPAAQVVHRRLTNHYGAARFQIKGGTLFVFQNGRLDVVVHRDDIQSWLFGREVPIKVGKEPDPAESGVEVQVGVMKATVKPGKDGKLGTDDDEITITPTTKIDGVVEYEEIDDNGTKIFKCTACGLTRKTKKGIVAHIERDH
jgi:hypothetical protein